MDDIMRQNPELMQQFTQAVNTMGESNPGFSNFMSDFHVEEITIVCHLLRLFLQEVPPPGPTQEMKT